MTLIKHTRRLWQTAEQYRYDSLCESIWRAMVYVAVVAGFVALPVVGFVLWGMI